MKCPHCRVSFHDNWDENSFYYGTDRTSWQYKTALCPACQKLIIKIVTPSTKHGDDFLVYPRGSNRAPVPVEVPPDIAEDYVEACNVLSISP